MNEVTQQRVGELVTQALERTAFVLADIIDDEAAQALPALTHYARIRYTGPHSGSVVVHASVGFLIELAASLLGVEREEVTAESDGLDAIKELANVIGGSLILELGGAECPYSLGLPELVTADQAAEISAGAPSCVFDSEGEQLRVHWTVDEAAKAAA